MDRSALLALARQVAPTTVAIDRGLPVAEVFTELLPSGLVRGQRVALVGPGGTSLALALAARASQGSSWVAVVGGTSMGLAAAEELGVRLDRLVVVDAPPARRWGATVAALFEGFEVVIVAPGHPVSARDDRRLAARAREEGAVVLQLGSRWSGADVELSVTATSWYGLGEGHGHLQARLVRVGATGRRGAARPRRLDLWLPDARGHLRPADPAEAVGPAKAVGPAEAVDPACGRPTGTGRPALSRVG